MNDQQLVEALSSVSQRYRRVIIGGATAGALGVAALGGIAVRQWLAGADYQLPMFAAGYAALLGGALSPILVHWLRKTRDPVWLAHKLEKKFPELDTRLLAAVEQPDKNKEGMGFLQQMVISQAVSHSRRNGWDQVVPEGRIKGAKLAQWGMVAACAVVGCTILWEAGRIVIAKVNAPKEKITAKAEVPFEIKVDVEKEIERGAPLLVTATFGIERLPSDVQLLFREKGAEAKQQGMSKSALNDPRFATRLPTVAKDIEVAVKYNSKQTEWYAVKVFDFPQLKEADAHLKYPEFTGQPEKDIPNTRIVTAVEGTNATLTFKLNKPVAEATLVPAPRQQQRGGPGAGGRAGAGAPGAGPDAAGGPPAGRGGAIAGGPDAGVRGGAGGRGGAAGGRGRVNALAAQNGRGGANGVSPDGVGSPTVKLEQSKTDPTVYTVKLDLVTSQLYQLQLVDADKRNNRDKASMTINVTADRPATVRVTSPSRDVEVSPLEELTVKGQVSDDFGVKRVGITFTMRGEQQEMVIAENVAAKERRDIAKVISLEDLKAQPDELLAYNLWAEDIGPDGKLRRTQSDMFFAEVRPFEEIYRQAQQPADGQQQQQRQQQQQGNQQQQAAQRAEDITNQLKQILAAMWTVSRREVNEKVTSEFVPDIQAILESQNAVAEAATGLEERVTDQRAQNFLESGMKNLQKAADLLKKAEGADSPDGASAKPLPDAIAADQAAYNDFLKLRDRQFEVVRGGRQGQQGNTAQARRQQQLNQLDLQDQQNRYQTQRQAQQEQEEQQRAQQQAEQQENRQVLNRLRDLAQRQQDLNQQIRETQSALQEAQTQQQREEAQRQLARLQEQQQEQLQQTDELRNRLDEPQNAESMADARQQLDQARQNVQQAAQALAQGQADQAAAAGQRASEQLNNLQDQVRRNAAGQFADAMQGMRNDARALEQGAQENAQQLADLEQANRDPQPGQGGLRNTQQQEAQATRQQLAQNLDQQRNQLNRLMENMQQTVQEAETAEPILARQLYDTIRQSQQRPPERALDNTQQLVRQGFTQQARQTNDEAVQGISRIREGVEQAASGVLGDETESLRRAREELDALSAQLEREIGRNIQEQQAQNAARGGRGQNPQNPQQAQNGRNGRGQGAGQNPDGQNPDDRQLADGGRGGRDGQQPGAAGQQPGAGRGQDPGQRGGRGQGQGQEPGQGQGDDRQARGGRGQGQGENGDPNAEAGGRGQGQRGGRGQGQGDPQVAGGQPGDPQGQQPGAGRGQGQRGGRGQGQGAGENPDPNGDPQLAGGQPGDPQGQPGGRGQGQRGGRGQGQGAGENPDPNGDPQLAGGQPGDPQGQPGGRGQGQRGGRAGLGQGQGAGENPDPNGDPQLAGQPGGRGQGQRGGQPGDPNQQGQPGDPNQEGQPGDPQLAEGQNPDGQPGGNRGGGRGQGQRGGPGLRGGAGGGGPQDPNDPNQQNPQLARGGGGGNPNLNPLQIGGGGGGASTNDPLTGGGYRNFSDRLRDVQDMVSDPQLQRQAQQVRERASAVRMDVQRNTPPNWNMVSETIGKPLAELRDKVNQELLKRDKAQAALVPLDREPVPPEFQEQVKQYYEKLGSGK